MLPLQGHEANPQSCLNQAVVQAKKYGPATIRETHIAVPEVLGQVCFNTQQHFVAAGNFGTEREQQAAIFKTDGRPIYSYKWQEDF